MGWGREVSCLAPSVHRNGNLHGGNCSIPRRLFRIPSCCDARSSSSGPSTSVPRFRTTAACATGPVALYLPRRWLPLSVGGQNDINPTSQSCRLRSEEGRWHPNTNVKTPNMMNNLSLLEAKGSENQAEFKILEDFFIFHALRMMVI